MSYYYTYYIGYKLNNKIYPLGPYSATGKMKPVVEKSRSYASDLHEDFNYVSDAMISDELRKEFEYEDYEEKKVMPKLKYLPISEMTSRSFIDTGYFLIDDVSRYEETGDYEDLKYNRISPTVYAAMAANEKSFGAPEKKYDIEGEELEVHSARDYMFYAYPNYFSKEYEADVIRTVAYMLGDDDSNLPKGYELVAIETEG